MNIILVTYNTRVHTSSNMDRNTSGKFKVGLTVTGRSSYLVRIKTLQNSDVHPMNFSICLSQFSVDDLLTQYVCFHSIHTYLKTLTGTARIYLHFA